MLKPIAFGEFTVESKQAIIYPIHFSSMMEIKHQHLRTFLVLMNGSLV